MLSINSKQECQSDVAEGYGLSEDVYSFGYSLRLKYSTFQQLTIKWLVDNRHGMISADSPKILSLGCGDGAFDIEIIDRLGDEGRQFQFSGLDFNATDLGYFRHLLSTRPGNVQQCVNLRHMKFDASTDLQERYDFIYMVHFLQSFEEFLPVIRNALSHLAPGGRLLIVQQQRQGIYELKRSFQSVLTNRKFHSSEEIKRSLQKDGILFDSHTIDTCFDISVMRRKSLDALLLMSFCFTDDLAVLEERQQEEIREAFLAYSTIDENGAPFIYEPMDAILCQA